MGYVCLWVMDLVVYRYIPVKHRLSNILSTLCLFSYQKSIHENGMMG